MQNYNNRLLRGKIKAEYNTQAEFAKMMKMSEATLSAKLNHTSDFTQSEIKKAAELLHLNNDEILLLFFAEKV